MANAQTQLGVFDLVKTASIDDVFLALRTPYLGTRIEVTDDHGRVFKLQVLSLFHEDGSGRSLGISGNAELTHTANVRFNALGSKRYEAYLNFKGGGRKGWIKVLD